MGAAPLPGDAEALALGRSLHRVGNGVNNDVKTLAEQINVHTRTRNERLPVSPTRRGKHKMKQSESMVFDLLFDSIDGSAEDMDDILGEETQHDSDSDNEQHDPVSVYVRIVRTMSRPKSALERSIHKRFQCAYDEVGPGDVGDAKHIEQLRRAFNAYEYDPWGEPVRKRPVSPQGMLHDKVLHDKAEKDALDDALADDQAFVATTPGAVGHAALLNLRHSFLWLKLPSDEVDGDASDNLQQRSPTEEQPVTRLATSAHGPVPLNAHLPSVLETSSSSVDTASTILIMEPDIKAHFVISRPTAAYQRLVDTLPKCFVGTHHSLVKLVDFICEQMVASFLEADMSVPPWRKNKAILSKWFLPTAKSASHPGTPTGSPEGSKQKKDSVRRMSFDLVGGGNVVGVGEAYQGEFDKVFSHDKPDMDRRDWKNHRIAVGAGA